MGPLQGLRIVEFAGIGPAPFCGMMLADMGAEVILIERKHDNPNTAGLVANDRRLEFLHRGKQSIAVDLKQAGAKQTVMKIIAGADAVLEGFRPGVMERLGLGPDECRVENPQLVYGRMTGWGQTGPLSQAAGHDINYIALSGALFYSGRDNSAPLAPPTLVGDIGGGAMVMVAGLLAALLSAHKTGEGQVVDAAIVDGAAYSTTLLYALFKQGHWGSARYANALDGAAHWYDCYECADGKFVSVGALEPDFYQLLLQKLGLENDDDYARQLDQRSWPELKRKFSALFRQKPQQDWCALLEGSDACFAPVLDFEEAAQHPHNKARDTFVDIDGVLQPAPAPRFSRTPSAAAVAPEIGEHCDAILTAAGLSAADIEALREQGVV
jgi:alpha-methylacyl-CoA racemase